MKVLFWTSHFWPELGGLERISAELVLGLHRRGVEMHVLTSGEGPERFHGVPVHRLPMPLSDRVWAPETLFELRERVARLKRHLRPDLVHVNGYTSGVLLHALTRKLDVPTLVTLHGSWPRGEEGAPSVADRMLAEADWVCGCSTWAVAQLRSAFPAQRQRSSVVLNALWWRPETVKAQRSDLLVAGRLSPEKGYDLAIRTLAHLPEMRLRVAGTGFAEPELRSLAAELGVSSRVDFLGRLGDDQLSCELSQARALLCPSRDEGFGLIALEAAWHGTAVVASRVGGLPEVVLHEESGLLVSSRDPGDWADAVRSLDGYPEMGARARRRVERSFFPQPFVDAYDELYTRLGASEGPLRTVNRSRLDSTPVETERNGSP